uniref:hypothetical protein n=1 Tax=Trichocoleus desertorum TaxID=1481672 RepID=UPI0025B4692B|nr:hypothetical protein [Trichocoleus desertorum]
MFTFTKIADYQTSIPTPASIPDTQNPFSNLLRSFKGILKRQEQISTPRPTFGNFSPPAIAGKQIIFSGSPTQAFNRNTKCYQDGIYSYQNGILSVVANVLTPVPQQDATFGGFHCLAVSSEAIAFVGVSQEVYPSRPDRQPGPYELDYGMSKNPLKEWGPQLKDWGIYLYHQGELQIVADSTMLMPNSNLKFGFFRTPFLVGTDVVFWAKSAPTEGYLQSADFVHYLQQLPKPYIEGIYRWHDGTLEVIADSTTSTFRSFDEFPIADGQAVYFSVWTWDGKNRAKKFFRFTDSPTEIPHIHPKDYAWGPGTAAMGDRVLHSFHSEPQVQLSSLAEPGKSEIVAVPRIPVPKGLGHIFQGFAEVAMDQDTLALVGQFWGDPSPANIYYQSGIYTRSTKPLSSMVKVGDRLSDEDLDRLSQSLSRVIATGDLLDQKIVNRLRLNPQGISGKALVFLVEFNDGSQAIYRANWQQ